MFAKIYYFNTVTVQNPLLIDFVEDYIVGVALFVELLALDGENEALVNKFEAVA